MLPLRAPLNNDIWNSWRVCLQMQVRLFYDTCGLSKEPELVTLMKPYTWQEFYLGSDNIDDIQVLPSSPWEILYYARHKLGNVALQLSASKGMMMYIHPLRWRSNTNAVTKAPCGNFSPKPLSYSSTLPTTHTILDHSLHLDRHKCAHNTSNLSWLGKWHNNSFSSHERAQTSRSRVTTKLLCPCLPEELWRGSYCAHWPGPLKSTCTDN